MKSLTVVSLAVLLAACGGGTGSQGSSGGPSPTPSASASPTPSPSPTPLPEPTNVVFFIIDDLAVQDANFMQIGSTTRDTPRIDALAAQSVVLTNYHTVSPICTPSRYALLTGNYPSRATNTSFAKRLAAEGSAVPEFNALITTSEMTLPKRLHSLGFRTGFSGKDHVVEDIGYSPPKMDSHLADTGVADQLEQNRQFVLQGMRDIGFDEAFSIYKTNPLEQPVVETRVHNLDWIVDGALKFIDNNADKKFFLTVSFTIPHGPLGAAASWNADPRMTPWGYLTTAPSVMPARSTLTARVKAAKHSGDENYLWLDDAVGAVVDKLNQKGLSENTAIVFIGDNGMGAKGSVYVPGSLTPAFIYYRGTAGRTNALVSSIDLQPTILDMLGAAPVGDGVSMMPILRGASASTRNNVVLELGYARAVLQDGFEYIAMRHSDYIKLLAQSKGYPLTEWLTYQGVSPLEEANRKLFPSYLAADQLYNYQVDPSEQSNLYGQSQFLQQITKMQDTLQAHVETTPGKFVVR